MTEALLAFIEGLGLAFSPCILPILPLIFAASNTGGKARPLQIVFGFIISFTLFSLLSRQVLLITGLQWDEIQTFAFILLLFFGIFLLVPGLENQFARRTNSLAARAQQVSQRFLNKPGGAIIMGALIGIVWTPCAGPILAIALLQVIQSQTNAHAIFIILAFSFGAAIPMLLVGYGGRFIASALSRLTHHALLIRRCLGGLIIVVAVLGMLGFNLGEWVAVYSDREEPLLAKNHLINPIAAPYEAPEIAGIDEWINSAPLTLASLTGKVVLVDFWTYSCINCIRTLPHLERWYQQYKKDGLVVLGIHSPEFSFEQRLVNVQKAVKKFGLTYPIALDNQFATWRNYNNHYWPAHYLINKKGMVVYIHLGEGDYNVMENNIRYLLHLDVGDEYSSTVVPISSEQTAETYLGTARAERKSEATPVPLHHWYLSGRWQSYPQYIENEESGAQLTLHYKAKKVFLVVENSGVQPGAIEVIRDNKHKSQISINESKLYLLVDNDNTELKDEVIEVKALSPHLRFYAFTFEG